VFTVGIRGSFPGRGSDGIENFEAFMVVMFQVEVFWVVLQGQIADF
jgi:hypothetical protein